MCATQTGIIEPFFITDLHGKVLEKKNVCALALFKRIYKQWFVTVRIRCALSSLPQSLGLEKVGVWSICSHFTAVLNHSSKSGLILVVFLVKTLHSGKMDILTGIWLTTSASITASGIYILVANFCKLRSQPRHLLSQANSPDWCMTANTCPNVLTCDTLTLKCTPWVSVTNRFWPITCWSHP